MKDPRDIPGLAHFCEHMLFLGTKKVKLDCPLYETCLVFHEDYDSSKLGAYIHGISLWT